jgi:hypothetical protein
MGVLLIFIIVNFFVNFLIVQLIVQCWDKAKASGKAMANIFNTSVYCDDHK